MSGFEIWGAIAGVIGTLEAIVATRHRSQTTFLNGQPSLEAASFRKHQIRAELESLALNRDIYERHIETQLQGDDRENITNIWQQLGDVVQRSKTVAERLLAGVRRNRLIKEEIEECVTELDSNAMRVNTWVGQLNVALQLAAGSLRTQNSCISPPPSAPPPSAPLVIFDNDAGLKLWIEEDNLEKVQRFLSSSSEGPKRDSRNATALLLACRLRRKSIVQYCLSLGADTSLCDDCGLSCLHAVIGTVDVGDDASKISDIINLLLEGEVDPSIPDSGERGFTPLHYAADTQNLGAVKALLKRDKTRINATDAQGKTALWYACLHPKPDMNVIKNLASKGGDFVDHRMPPLSGDNGDLVKSILEQDGRLKLETYD
ncbi:MAG: hypothetical protein Q9213_004434 [Squamulea squamosa]